MYQMISKSSLMEKVSFESLFTNNLRNQFLDQDLKEVTFNSN